MLNKCTRSQITSYNEDYKPVTMKITNGHLSKYVVHVNRLRHMQSSVPRLQCNEDTSWIPLRIENSITPDNPLEHRYSLQDDIPRLSEISKHEI